MRLRIRALDSKFRIGFVTGLVGTGCYYYASSKNKKAVDNINGDSEEFVGQVGQTHAKKPLLFQWSSIPKFIEKRYDPKWAEEHSNGWLWNAGNTLVVGGVGTVAKIFLKYFEHTRVYNLDKLLEVVEQEDRERALITVSNHESVWDDPILWGVLPIETLFSPHKMRWVLGAADICFTTLFRSMFFSLGQAIPTIRGSGIYQPGVDFAIYKSNQNGWIHIFPEARVNQTTSMIRFKWGIGRIIMESDRCPIVVPVWHNGMAQVRPLHGPPVQFFKPITLAFGDPIDFQDTLDAWRAGKISETEARIKITSTIFDALAELKEKTQRMKRDLESGTVSDNEGDLKNTVKP
ncbi:acyltransferase-domain-containing protein [Zychaea mexicana]|uniref:acyltransferase-domain-containing protein n=1 Tax=Zychaea mexicana TaxID=64656 RepID=UPI0022FF34A7|nr:acyltransferase-domain-containing protein [Zychaea mexicana]KAI9490389.1 acyltransferase-domain-containing protein [Zychaea mexicana]